MTKVVYNPFIFGRPIEVHEPFFNRGHELAWLLHSSRRRRSEHPLLLTGAPGSGKTSIIKRLAEYSVEENLTTIIIDSQQVVQSELRNSLFELSRAIASQVDSNDMKLPKLQRRKLVTKPEEEFTQAFWQPMVNSLGKRNLMLAFDNAEGLFAQSIGRGQETPLLDIIRHLFENYSAIQFLYVLQDREFIKPSIIGFAPDKSGILELGNFELEEALNIIDLLHPYRVANDVRKYFHDLTGGHPNDLQRLCHFLYDRCHRLGLKHITMADIAVVIFTDPSPGDYYMPVYLRRNIYKYKFPRKSEPSV